MLLYHIAQLQETMINRKHILFEDTEEGSSWVATYYLNSADVDDSFEAEDLIEIVLTAPDFDTAVKYAQQYLRKMQTEEETASTWANAEILSVELH